MDQILADLKVGNLILCGAQSNNCVRHTSHAALEKGYDITLVGDAHTTSDDQYAGMKLSAEQIVAEQNRAFAHYGLPDRKAVVRTTAEAL